MHSKNKFRRISSYINIVEDKLLLHLKKNIIFFYNITLIRIVVPGPWIFILKERVAPTSQILICRLTLVRTCEKKSVVAYIE